MSWSYINVGAVGDSAAEHPSAVTATLPAYATGDLLLLAITTRDPTDTITTAPSGYTLLTQDDAGTYTGGIWLYGKIAGASESAPTFTVTSMSRCVHQMASFRDSSGVTAPGSIVHATGKGDTANNTNATITYPTCTISAGNTLVIYLLTKQKAIDEETTVATLVGFSELGDHRPNYASSLVTAWGYQIQTAAASITGSTVALTTWTESSARAERAVVVSLLSSSVKYLKVKTHSSAASATSVEGVVLNADRDTVIGEFTGQAFEASLESGEAVLKVNTTDISPDGGTLTTSDTPLAIAYNATYSTPLVSCTVIEE